MRTPGAALAVGSLLLTAPAAYAEPVRPGEESNFALGMLPASTPEVLRRAASAPYVAPASPDCDGIAREIATLDAVLGPDADAPRKSGTDTGKVVGQAVKSLIPYRSVVRFVTGADHRQRRRDEAAMAGWARRGYLKGIQVSQSCPGATAAGMVAVAPPTPDFVPASLADADAPTAAPAPAIAQAPEAPNPAPAMRVDAPSPPEPATIETTLSR